MLLTAGETDCWMMRSTIPRLTEGTIHVWRAMLDAPRPVVDGLEVVLSHDERQRTERFPVERHRLRFVVGRACLRILLGGYLRQAPDKLEFSYGSHGKPTLRAGQVAEVIRFNLAHSRGLALYAFALNREVGIDVEHWHAMEDGPGIARRFFAPDEVRELAAVPPHQWEEGFFRCWTRKEAYIKARGEGLTIPLRHFSITTQPGDRGALLRSAADPEGPSRWSVEELRPAELSSGAIVAEGTDWSIERFQLPEWPDRYEDVTPWFRQLE